MLTIAFLRQSHCVMLAVLFAVAYGLGAMVLGGMLIFAHLSPPYGAEILWSPGPGQPAWDYPGLYWIQPWGVLALPFFPTLAMVATSAGVGLGMAVAALLTVRLVRLRRANAGRATAVGGLAGLTPAMVALVTLGACCSTAAAASAGVEVVALTTGTTATTLLTNNWYLGAFQVVVVWLAVVAQELLLRVYGSTFGISDPGRVPPAVSSAPIDRRFVAGALLRIALLVAGLTWALAAVADWTTVNPLTAGPGWWFDWGAEHFLVGGFAVAAALAPDSVSSGWRRLGSVRAGAVLRAVWILAGGALAVGTPPIVAAAGAHGWVNEILYVAGAPASAGAVSPAFSLGAALALRWAFQYLLLGGFAVAAALRPTGAFELLRRTAARVAASPPPVVSADLGGVAANVTSAVSSSEP